MVPFHLIPKNLFSSTLVSLRTLLTMGSLVIAIFLLCVLRALVVSLDAGVQGAASNRLVVQSAVSLFVDLPLSYQGKIETVPGVKETSKFQWFGGYYKERSNFFAQFAVDHDVFLDVYPEVELIEGSADAFKQNRVGCLIGTRLVRDYGFKVGDTVPVTGTIFAKAEPWEFVVEGIYRSKSSNVDDNTMFFHFDYLNESLESGVAVGPRGAGTYMIEVAPGARVEDVQQGVDALFENGPQRVNTTTEAEFQRQFVSMVGSLPTFLQSIGGGVLFAIVLAVINTMLMAGRERTVDMGILKALGFTDGVTSSLLVFESLLLCTAGGLLGVGLALFAEPGFVANLGAMFPGFKITGEIVGQAIALSVGIGILAGIVPAWRAIRLRPVQALREEA